MFESSEELAELDAVQLASAITDNQAVLRRAECRVLELACAWADVHSREPGKWSPLVERSRFFGGDGTPALEEFCIAEFGALHGIGTLSAQLLIADALDLRHRLPRLWAQVRAGQVRAWQARKIAERTRPLAREACAEVDAQLSGVVGLLPWGRFQRILTAAVLEADPGLATERERRARELRDVWATDSDEGLRTIVARAAAGDAVWFLATVNRIADVLAADGDRDPVGLRRSKAIGILARPAEALRLLAAHHDPADRADGAEPPEDPAAPPDRHVSLVAEPPTAAQRRAGRPRVVLHFHLADATLRRGVGLVRPGHGGEPLTLRELHDWLADTGCSVTVRPVLDPADARPVDAYEIPQQLRDQVRYRDIADVFPYGTCTSATMDLDHTIPWVPLSRGGPPGQTRPDNLGPLTRRHHRVLTHGRWRRRQPDAGTYLYRSPTGQVFLVTNQGTLRLGASAFARATWHSANYVDTEIAA